MFETAPDAVKRGPENPVLENIRERRSVRRFLKQPVPEDLLLAVLEAANCAPSAHNKQAWKFIVIRDEAKLSAPFPKYHNV